MAGRIWSIYSRDYCVANYKLAVGKKQLAILQYFLFTVLYDTFRDYKSLQNPVKLEF